MNCKGILLFDIDGVIRDVTGSYRLAIQETVYHFTNWKPSIAEIDKLKEEGSWNNDWGASLELIKRHQANLSKTNKQAIPSYQSIVKVFSDFYFGGDPEGDPQQWEGFIRNEPLLVTNDLFNELNSSQIKWGFVSGAEHSSALFVLRQRLGLENPVLIAMGDAPEKPNPEGLIQIATQLVGEELGEKAPPVAYIGDTVADVLTIKNARKNIPSQRFKSIGIAPPHLHDESMKNLRFKYERKLKQVGAEIIIARTDKIINELAKIF